MASFFGEVVFPVSRAFWDGEDIDEDTKISTSEPYFNIHWLKEEPTQIDTLVVVTKEVLIEISKECLCHNSKEVCYVEVGLSTKQKKVCSIFQVNDDVYVCILSPEFEIKFSGMFTDTISNIICNAKNIICITCQHISKFKGKGVSEASSFLRMLATKNGENVCKLKVPLLEQPNIVAGVAAGVLSYAECMEIPAVLYVLYLDGMILDSVSAAPLLELFAAMNCTSHDFTFPGNKFFMLGNLYM